MSISSWKQKIYDSYVSNGFGDAHDIKKYKIYNKYFKRNYLKFMPHEKNCRILELGCGMGEFYSFCKNEGFKNYTGIDASIENITYIKKYFGEDSNVSVVDMFDFFNGVRKKQDKKLYDVVIFNDVIEHLTKPEIMDILNKVYTNLDKNGVFLIKTPNMANPFINTAGRYIDFTHEIGFTEKSMTQILRASGFSDIKIIGTDIYVFNPLISIVAKIFSKTINLFLFLLSALYGRTSLKIFDKDILAIAYKRDINAK